MTDPSDVSLKYGRRKPVNKRAIQFADIRTAAVPEHPLVADHLSKFSAWNMLGNDLAGDCVAVTWANIRRLMTALVGAEYYPTQQEVWDVYRIQNPTFDPHGDEYSNGPGSSADQGMDIQLLLEYAVKNGLRENGTVVKPLAFAKVNLSNLEEVEAAIDIFGCVWLGINVQYANMTQFNRGTPWDYVAGSPNDGGHSIVTARYSDTDVTTCVTWARQQDMTVRFWQHQAEEAWVVIWPENLGTEQFDTGVSQEALAAAYQELTGRPFPVKPTPTPPVPAPVPPAPVQPPVADADAALVAAAHKWLATRHTGSNRTMGEAIKAWAAEKGYTL